MVVDLRPNKTVHESLIICIGGDKMESLMETTTRTADLVYTRLVVDLRPNKTVHESLIICMGGDKMESLMETTTRTADLTTCKLHINLVVSTPGAIFAGGDVKYF